MATKMDDRTQIIQNLLRSTTSPLNAYFAVYEDLMARAEVPVLQVEDPATIGLTPICCSDVLKAAELLRQRPNVTLGESVEELRSKFAGSHSTAQIRHAVFVAVRLMLMLDCAASRWPYEWRNNQRYIDFVRLCLQKNWLVSKRVSEASRGRKSLKAWKLKSRMGLSIVGTDNLARHLELDTDALKLYVFHHTSFLRAQKPVSGGMLSDEWLLNLSRGRLPPGLVAETLSTINEILFPFDDDRSTKILHRLIDRHGFDSDCANLNPVISNGSHGHDYVYWGERLADLYELTQQRPPRTKFDKWMRWRTSESNAFAVALAALCISIVVGILTLGLGGVQVWIAWKAWKEPVDDGSQMTIRVEDLATWIREHDR